MTPRAEERRLVAPPPLPAWGKDRCDAEAVSRRPQGRDAEVLGFPVFCARVRGHDGAHSTRPRRVLRRRGHPERWRCLQWQGAVAGSRADATSLGVDRPAAVYAWLDRPPPRAGDDAVRCASRAYLWGYISSRAGGGWFPVDVACARPSGHAGHHQVAAPYAGIPGWTRSWIRGRGHRVVTWGEVGERIDPPVIDGLRTMAVRWALCLVVVAVASLWLVEALSR